MNEGKKVSRAPFKFRNFIISESHIKIESNSNPDSIDVRIDPSGIINKEKGLYDVQLKIFLHSNDGFEVYVKMIGNFEFNQVLEKDNLSNYFYVNAPAIIFPYLRSYISALTALSGCKTIILPPMNVISLGKDLEKNTIIK